jgi:hypothetical protein
MTTLQRTGAGASMSMRIASPSMTNLPAVRPKPRWPLLVLLFVLSVGLAAGWTFFARQQFDEALLEETGRHLDSARKVFEATRAQTQANLQSQCRVLSDDPRLKTTLATAGMDSATVADILKDLGTLRGSGSLMVLAPDGRVFAEAGAPELQNLDLSTSSIVKKAQATQEAAVGSWVLAGKLMDLSIMALRTALADKVVLSSSNDAVFAEVGRTSDTFEHRLVSVGGNRYMASVIALGDTAQSQRLLLVRSVDHSTAMFSTVQLMLFVPPGLVAIAVLLMIFGTRSRRT